jgi:hypothetical protein
MMMGCPGAILELQVKFLAWSATIFSKLILLETLSPPNLAGALQLVAFSHQH